MPLPYPLHRAYVRLQFAVRRVLGVPLVEKIRYLRTHGRWPKLDAPRTLTEKIFVRKLLHGDDARFPIIADKVASRDWVAQRVGEEYLIPIAGVYDYHELDRLELRPGEVVKCANRSGGVYFTSDIDPADREPFIARLRRDLEFDFALWTGEPWYARIPRRVVVEKSLADEQGRIPSDYKFFVYDGRVQSIQMHIDRFGEHKRVLFDREWRLIPTDNSIPDPVPAAPTCLPRMIEIAETLGREFDFIRVDLFEINGERIYFGELTLAPGSGLSRFHPPAFDEVFGRYWQLDQTSRLTLNEERRLQAKA